VLHILCGNREVSAYIKKVIPSPVEEEDITVSATFSYLLTLLHQGKGHIADCKTNMSSYTEFTTAFSVGRNRSN
jgi:hypothetical protein